MAARNYQPAFAAGVLAPSLFARVDLARYALGARTIRNAFVQKQGGVCNRPGFGYVGNVADHATAPRLIPFAFNTTQTYALEFGDYYMRVIKDGGHVVEDSILILAATASDPVAITTDGPHGYSTGDEVLIAGVGGMTALNNRRFRLVVTGADSFTLQDIDGTALDGSQFDAYIGDGASVPYGTVARVYTLATPYPIAAVQALQYTQSADVMTLVHPDHPPQELTRTDHDAWTFAAIAFGNGAIAPPNNLTENGVYTSTRSRWFTYKVTAVDAAGNESLSGYGNRYSITGFTQANPGVLTLGTSNVMQVGDEVLITNVGGMTALNDRRFRIAKVLSNTTVTLEEMDGTPLDTSTYDAYTAGGTLTFCFYAGKWHQERALSPGSVRWDHVPGAAYYRIYFSGPLGTYQNRRQSSVYGFSGDTDTLSYTDENVRVDSTDRPPRAVSIFDAVHHYPGTVTYFEQRRAFANSIAAPQTFWLSQTGRHANFNSSQPLRDDDALEFTVQHTEVNAIRHMVSNQGKLILFTSGAEWLVNSGEVPISASNIPKLEPQSTNGAAAIRPLVVNDTILYVDASERMVRDLKYSFERDARGGSDMSVMAEHLFADRRIVDWAYAKRPHNIIWMVMSDGRLVSLTYLPEHEIMAFAEHETAGSVRSVCTIREGNEDALYAVIQRTIGGAARTFVERLSTRRFATVADAFFVDCGGSYRGAPVTEIGGLWHLEGATVSGLADGEPFGDKLVSDGAIQFSTPKSVVHIGLPYQCDLETLPVGAVELQGRQHKIENAFIRVQATRGLSAGWAGREDSVHPLSDPYEDTATPHPLQEKMYKQPVQSDWRREGGLLMRSTDALPWTVMGVSLDVANGR